MHWGEAGAKKSQGVLMSMGQAMEGNLMKGTERKPAEEKKGNRKSLVSRKPKETFVSRRCGKQYEILHICSHWIRQ